MLKALFARLSPLMLASSLASAAQPLDMDAFIQAILDNNPGVQGILAQQAIAEGELESSRGIDDPVLASIGDDRSKLSPAKSTWRPAAISVPAIETRPRRTTSCTSST